MLSFVSVELCETHKGESIDRDGYGSSNEERAQVSGGFDLFIEMR